MIRKKTYEKTTILFLLALSLLISSAFAETILQDTVLLYRDGRNPMATHAEHTLLIPMLGQGVNVLLL